MCVLRMDRRDEGESGAMTDDNANKLEGVEGVVKWFDPRKGYGFIIGPDGKDVFAHFSVIEGDGFRVLRDGSKVIYDAELSGDRWKATRVERVDVPEVQVPGKRTYSRSPRR